MNTTDPEASTKNYDSDDKNEESSSSKKNSNDMDSKDQIACSSTSVTPTTSYSSRNDLIRDIESHIEIIFECFDLDDSVVATKSESSPADSSNEIVISSDVRQELDKKNEKVEDPEPEKKNEIQSD